MLPCVFVIDLLCISDSIDFLYKRLDGFATTFFWKKINLCLPLTLNWRGSTDIQEKAYYVSSKKKRGDHFNHPKTPESCRFFKTTNVPSPGALLEFWMIQVSFKIHTLLLARHGTAVVVVWPQMVHWCEQRPPAFVVTCWLQDRWVFGKKTTTKATWEYMNPNWNPQFSSWFSTKKTHTHTHTHTHTSNSQFLPGFFLRYIRYISGGPQKNV